MRWALFDSLPEPSQRAVLASCRRQRYGRGEAIFREGDFGDAVHLLERGTVAVRVSTPSGDIATLDVFGPGDAFGEQALIGNEVVRSATVVALERVETMRLARVDFEALLVEHPATVQLLVAMLDARLRATSRNLLDALYLAAETRVFRRLAQLADLYDHHESHSIPVTQDALATMAGATRQTVNGVLRKAEHEGIVRLARGKIEVLDRPALARRAR